MTLKIHRILKSNLAYQNSLDVVLSGMSKSCSMTISSYPYSVKNTCATLNFTVESVDNFIPYISDVDFGVVVRKKVDLAGTGKDENEITNTEPERDKDRGRENFKKSVPTSLSNLPPGFTQFLG